MRRVVLAVLLLGGLTLWGAGRTHADVTTVNGYCFSSPFQTLVSCTATPSGNPTSTPVPATPVKSLAVTGPVQGPDRVNSYGVTVTTQISCFTLAEPTVLYTLGSPGASALTELFPTPGVAAGNPVTVLTEQNPNAPGAGTANLTLEVNTREVGPEGVVLKAVWPQEGVERLSQIIAPQPATAVPTLPPGISPSPTPTAAPTSTATPLPTATSTNTPGPTATATAVPTQTPAAPLTVKICVLPQILNGATLHGEAAQVNGLTTPGASCSPSVLYLDGTTQSDLSGIVGTANSSGFVSFPFSENTGAGGGFSRLQCSLGTQTTTVCTGFLVLQTGDGNLSATDKQALIDSISAMVKDPVQCNSLFRQYGQ